MTARLDYTPDLTPVEMYKGEHGDVWFKRDDLYEMAGIRGGKVRSCWALATQYKYRGLITASARKSPQAQIVARLAARLGIPARLHMPTGEHTEEMRDMLAHGGELVQHKPGYNSVIVSRALDDSQEEAHRDWKYIPFGMECAEAMRSTAHQVSNIPTEVKRIVIVLGSGMSAAGILWGLVNRPLKIPVLGVRIGADPTKRLDRWAPPGWRHMMRVIDVTGKPGYKYEDEVQATPFGIRLDPHYEAKAYEYVRPGELFWCVGIRASLG